MCKICLKRPLDTTFLDCLALTFFDVISELLPELACLTLQGGTIFLLMSKVADIPVSRVRKCILFCKRHDSEIDGGRHCMKYYNCNAIGDSINDSYNFKIKAKLIRYKPLETASIFFPSEPLSKTGYWLGVCHP